MWCTLDLGRLFSWLSYGGALIVRFLSVGCCLSSWCICSYCMAIASCINMLRWYWLMIFLSFCFLLYLIWLLFLCFRILIWWTFLWTFWLFFWRIFLFRWIILLFRCFFLDFIWTILFWGLTLSLQFCLIILAWMALMWRFNLFLLYIFILWWNIWRRILLT